MIEANVTDETYGKPIFIQVGGVKHHLSKRDAIRLKNSLEKSINKILEREMLDGILISGD